MLEIETRAGDQWLDDTAIRIVELWSKVREAGYASELGFEPGNLRLSVDFVRWAGNVAQEPAATRSGSLAPVRRAE